MQCDCIKKVNKLLEASNTCLDVISLVNMKTNAYRPSLVIKTVRRSSRDKKSRVRTVTPTFCPFCGVAVRQEATEPATTDV